VARKHSTLVLGNQRKLTVCFTIAPQNPQLNAPDPSFGSRRTILPSPADIQKGQAQLQEDQSVSTIVGAPGYPEHVAQKEKPERPVTLEFSL
jgi:hypothetical protein